MAHRTSVKNSDPVSSQRRARISKYLNNKSSRHSRISELRSEISIDDLARLEYEIMSELDTRQLEEYLSITSCPICSSPIEMSKCIQCHYCQLEIMVPEWSQPVKVLEILNETLLKHALECSETISISSHAEIGVHVYCHKCSHESII